MPQYWSNSEDGQHFPMPTAIFVVYTKHGFVIGADGRKLGGEIERTKVISDTAQKIFPIENPGRSLAYAMCGTVGIDDIKGQTLAIDLTVEVEKAAKNL